MWSNRVHDICSCSLPGCMRGQGVGLHAGGHGRPRAGPAGSWLAACALLAGNHTHAVAALSAGAPHQCSPLGSNRGISSDSKLAKEGGVEGQGG